jgi:alpha-D-ribose 1-methylphosphonate 5-triphosphate synthase subunit PhnL
MPQTTLPTNSLALTKGGAYVELHYNAKCEAPAVGGVWHQEDCQNLCCWSATMLF